MAYTITNTYALDPSYTGASLRAQLYNSSNVAVGSPISTGFYERVGSQGLFAHSLAVPDDHVGWCDIYDNAAPSVILVSFPINPRELEYSDQKSSLISTKLGTPVGVSLAADIASIQADTNDIQVSAADITTIVNAILADTGVDGVAIATATMNALADAILGRSVANVQDTASIYTIAGLILAQFESSAPGTTWTIYKTDGSTVFATRSLTEDENAKQVVSVT